MALTVLLAVGFADASPGGKGSSAPGVTAITAMKVTDDALEIRGDSAFIYTIYKPSDPYRVLVEIPDADIGTFREVIKPKNSFITEVTPSQSNMPKPVAKIEILLQTPSGVDSQYSNNSLVLKAKKEEPEMRPVAVRTDQDMKLAQAMQDPRPDPAPKQEPSAEERIPLPKATEINDISFDGSSGAVRIVIKGNGAMSPSVFTLKNRIVIDVPNVALKTTPPSTVMAPVKGLRAGKYKDMIRLVVDLNGTKDFDVLSVKDTIIVALKPTGGAAEPSAAESPKTEMPRAAFPDRSGAEDRIAGKEPDALIAGSYTGSKISLDFQDSDIVPIFRLLSDISGYNMVVHPDVKGKLTMKLINVPWDQALDIILKTFNLGKSVDGNIIRVAPLAVFTKESEEIAKSRAAEKLAEPLETRFFSINYADVAVVKESIISAKVLTARGSVSVDKRTSTMVIKDGASVFPQVESLLASLDKPTAQVMIEGRIVEINTSDETDLGIQWGVKLSAANTLSQVAGLSGLGTGPFTGNKFMVDVPANVSGRGSGINFGILSPDRTFGLDIQLSALESLGNTKVISNPKVLTVDNGKAKIMQGKSIPIRKLTTEGTVSTEFKDITIELNVTPHITPDGSVDLDIEIKKEELDPSVPSIEGVPGTDKKEAKTKVIIRDGETIVIGGMYKVNDDHNLGGVPGLMKIPVLGWLFKNDHTKLATSELLIFITPRVVEKP
jgi:type IV pilus assembly protein PilQ